MCRSYIRHSQHIKKRFCWIRQHFIQQWAERNFGAWLASTRLLKLPRFIFRFIRFLLPCIPLKHTYIDVSNTATLVVVGVYQGWYARVPPARKTSTKEANFVHPSVSVHRFLSAKKRRRLILFGKSAELRAPYHGGKIGKATPPPSTLPHLSTY